MTTPDNQSPSLGFYYNKRDTRLKTRSFPDIGNMILKGSRGLDVLTREARRLYHDQEDAFKIAGSPEEPSRKDPSHDAFYTAYDAYKVLKDRLPAVTFSGTFQKRTDASKLAHSGLIGLDLDHLARAGLDADTIRTACATLPFTAGAFISPSGDGVKVFGLVNPIPQTDSEHRRAFDQVVAAYKDVFSVDVSDPSVKNTSRICFLSHDPAAVFKSVAEVTPLEVDLSEAPEPEPRRHSAPTPSVSGSFSRPSDDDAAIDRDALRFVHPPDGGGGEEYNAWLAWLATFKALGFTAAEVEVWSATGSRYTKGEVLARWETLPEDDPKNARKKLRGFAYNHGWPDIPGPVGAAQPSDETIVDVEEFTDTEETYSRTLKRALSRGEPPWYALGTWFAEKVPHQYVYYDSPQAPAWWHYDGQVWHLLLHHDSPLTNVVTQRLVSQVVRRRRNPEHRTLAPVGSLAVSPGAWLRAMPAADAVVRSIRRQHPRTPGHSAAWCR